MAKQSQLDQGAGIVKRGPEVPEIHGIAVVDYSIILQL